jgi:hypothetical protein
MSKGLVLTSQLPYFYISKIPGMKQLFILLATLICLVLNSHAQNNCGDDIFTQLQKSQTPNYEAIEKRNNLAINTYIKDHYQNATNKTTAGGTYVIPVVVHVVHPVGQAYGTGVNISLTQIQSQLAALNAAFAKSYPAYNGQTHPVYAQNTSIEFCLAKIAKPGSVTFYSGPGGTEFGVMRYADNTLTNHQMTATSATALAGLTHSTASHFPFTDYLNIWVVSSINGTGSGTIIGYAPKPLMGPYPLDGIVMRSDAFGDNSTGNSFNLSFNLEQGKVLAHEAGHYLNLYHIFEGGCAGANAAGASTDACDLNGDMICDIEPCNTQNISCTQPVPNTCSASYAVGTTTLDMIENYMSYADDDCMNTFTNNQSQRMAAFLNLSRSNLWQTTNLASTGVIGAGGCIAPFLMTTISLTGSSCVGSPVQLSNPLSGNSATSWTWTAIGGSPASANTSSINVTYTAPGTYWVKLKISDGSANATDSLLLSVTNCSIVPGKMNQANWYFGKNTSVTFTSGIAAPQSPSSINSFEPTASISDNTGKLLFYTDGGVVWNKNHAQMTNLGGYLFGYNYWQVSACQGALIIPMPMNSQKYYIFSSTQQPGNNPGDTTMRLRYSIIDMSLNGGLGEISSLNQIVPGPYMLTAEGQCAIPHCNGYDYWVLSKGAKTTGYKDKLAAYMVTAGGVLAPVISNAMFSIPTGTGTGTDPNEFISGMEASPDGKLVAITENLNAGAIGNSIVRIYSFNNATGVLTQASSVLFPFSGFLNGHQFSPDSKKLYITAGNDVRQIDLTNISSPTVAIIFNNMNYYRFQLGPDDKIYASTPVSNVNKLSVINFPNLAGTACSFSANAVSLFAANDVRLGLPNMIDAKKGAPVPPSFLASPVNCTTTQFSVDSCWTGYSGSWDFGDGSTGSGFITTHTYTSSGTFSVSLVLSVPGYTFSPVSQNVTVLPSTTPIAGPNAICKGTPFMNMYGVANSTGATYSWTATNGLVSGPSNLNNVNVWASGTGVITLSVQVNNGGCLSSATKTITIDSIPNIVFPNPMLVCNGSTMTLSATPGGGTYSGVGVSGTVFNSSITGVGSHVVNYTYTSSNGCSASKSGTVTVNSCTGINEAEAIGSIRIYPNPNKGECTISVDRLLVDGEVEVYNCIGQVLLKLPMKQIVSLNLSEFGNGIYFVRIKESGQVIRVEKLIKY